MDNLGFGLGVTLAGLGIVFGLLAVLWLLLSVAIRLDRRGADALPIAPEAAGASAPDAQPVAIVLDPRLVAAITVAVVRHTDERRRQAAPAMRSYSPGSLLFASRWVDAGRMRQGQPWRRRAR
jgi:Na+-transporting methylmalonyl-CoA/oxaloacetate decarboxylase gamma subunit